MYVYFWRGTTYDEPTPYMPTMSVLTRVIRIKMNVKLITSVSSPNEMSFLQ